MLFYTKEYFVMTDFIHNLSSMHNNGTVEGVKIDLSKLNDKLVKEAFETL